MRVRTPAQRRVCVFSSGLGRLITVCIPHWSRVHTHTQTLSLLLTAMQGLSQQLHAPKRGERSSSLFGCWEGFRHEMIDQGLT